MRKTIKTEIGDGKLKKFPELTPRKEEFFGDNMQSKSENAGRYLEKIAGQTYPRRCFTSFENTKDLH